MKNQTEIEKLIRDTGLKATPARLSLLQTISDSKLPINAEEIISRHPGLDSVTVYRTLQSFEKAGLVRKVDLRKSSTHYEFAGHHHHHIVCTECGAVEDVEECGLDSIAKRVVRNSSIFSKINDHSAEFFGICNTCAKV